MWDMELSEAIQQRRSTREFLGRPVQQDQIEEILEAARLAPSATNRQPWRFVILQQEKEKELIAEAVTQTFVVNAPVVFVCCLDRSVFTREVVSQRIEELVEINVISREVADLLYLRKMPESVKEAGIPLSAFIDMGIAVEHMVLRACSLNLGSCWVRMFDADRLHALLGLPAEIEVIALLPVGYPVSVPGQRPRLSREDIVLQPRTNKE